MLQLLSSLHLLHEQYIYILIVVVVNFIVVVVVVGAVILHANV